MNEEFPFDVFPETEDPDRVMHLYSDDINDFEDVKRFWERNLHLYCVYKKSLRTNLVDLTSFFTIDGIVPASLSPMMSHFGKSGDIMTVQSLSSPLSSVQRTWAGFLLAFVIPDQVCIDVLREDVVSTHVVVKCIEAILSGASSLHPNDLICYADGGDENGLQRHRTPLSFRTLIERCISRCEPGNQYIGLLKSVDETDLVVIQKIMVSEGYAVMNVEKTVMKLVRQRKSSSSSSSSSSSPSKNMVGTAAGVDDAEVHMLNIKAAAFQLEEIMDGLGIKAADYLQKASFYKMKGSEKQALAQLHLRRAAIQKRDKLANSHFQLLEALETIESCATNTVIHDAYRSATQALQLTRGQANLTPESVEEALAAFQDEVDAASLIGDAIASGAGSNTANAEDEDELMRELESLMHDATISSPSPALSSTAVSDTERAADGMKSISELLPEVPCSSLTVENDAVKRAAIKQGASKVELLSESKPVALS